jgi:NAD(P)H-dependent glutamate synthase small subunit
MSGGIAYLYEAALENINNQTVYIEAVTYEDKKILEYQVSEHLRLTGSPKAKKLLDNWAVEAPKFKKVFPMDYKRVLKDALVEHVKASSKNAGELLDDFDRNRASAAGTTATALHRRNREKEMRARYKQFREGKAEKSYQSILPALGLGDISPYFDEVFTRSGGSETLTAFRQAYMMWRKGHHGRMQKLMPQEAGLDFAPERSASFKESELPESTIRRIVHVSSNQEMATRARVDSFDLNIESTDNDSMVETKSSKELPKRSNTVAWNGDGSDVKMAADMEDVTPVVKPAKKSVDLEDVGTVPKKPTSTAYPDKKRGFHIYGRQAITYRDPKTRVNDWEEIFEGPKKGKQSKKYEQLMRTQTARCMDCGTPTCSFPNQLGGGCPLSNRIPTWNELVHQNDWKRALERLLDTNNFPEFTGTTCPAPCEESCVLGINEDPVAIKSVEMAIIENGFQRGWVKAVPPVGRTDFRVAVIGSGPCGMAASQQLNRAGNNITMFERADRVGGLLVYGIPNMKLDKTKVERRANLLEEEGIEIKCGVQIGAPGFPSIESLSRDYDAVVLATGATRARKAGILGDNLKGVHQAMDFLTAAQKTQVDEKDEAFIDAAGKDVVVLGGGDTAADCLATAIRMGAKSVVQFSRRPRADEYHYKPGQYRERPQRTPWPGWADVYRVDYAHQEAGGTSNSRAGGVDPREYSVRTTKILEDKNTGRMDGVLAVQVQIVGGRVVDVAGSEKIYPCQLLLVALGFTGPEALDGVPSNSTGFEASYGNYKVEPLKNVFCAGDCRRGASLVVTAIAEGRDVAYRVDEYLHGDTALPRCAPLAQNPSLYEPETRSRRKKPERELSVEVESEFSRGLVGEPSRRRRVVIGAGLKG